MLRLFTDWGDKGGAYVCCEGTTAEDGSSRISFSVYCVCF